MPLRQVEIMPADGCAWPAWWKWALGCLPLALFAAFLLLMVWLGRA